jgi:hypothetical protein
MCIIFINYLRTPQQSFFFCALLNLRIAHLQNDFFAKKKIQTVPKIKKMRAKKNNKKKSSRAKKKCTN